jgi:methylenetetrahydrofolate dehydrogenase (NADP+)/methenyltetrahydrofolate cyclohydrolase
MVKLINGKKISQGILKKIKAKVKKMKVKPCLAVFLVGKNPASKTYVSQKEQVAKQIGVRFEKIIFKETTKATEIIDKIDQLNKDKEVHGIMVQLPLPNNLQSLLILQAITLKKDVEGVNNKKIISPFVLAIAEALKATKVNLKKKRIMALVNSKYFGQQLRSYWQKQKIQLNYLPAEKVRKIRQADVVISACGVPKLINKNYIKKDCVLIDGGFTKKGKKILGDVDVESIKKKVKFLTPVPGGIGPITVAMLYSNLLVLKKK